MNVLNSFGTGRNLRICATCNSDVPCGRVSPSDLRSMTSVLRLITYLPYGKSSVLCYATFI